MKFILKAASALLKHSKQPPQKIVEPTAHERALLLLKERVMAVKEPLEKMMESLPSLASLSLKFEDCQASMARMFQEEPMQATLAVVLLLVILVLAIRLVTARRRRQDKNMERSASFSLEKKSAKATNAAAIVCVEREARWKALLLSRPVTNKNEAMSAWLMEVLSVSDLQAPLRRISSSNDTASIDSNDATAASFATSTTGFSDFKVTMPFVNTWNDNSTNNLNESEASREEDSDEEEEWTDEDPGREMSF